MKPVDSHNGSDIARVADGVEPPTKSVRVWRWISAAPALSQLAAPTNADVLAGDFLSSGATNEATITPSGYAFSIWGLICVLCVVTAAAIVRFGLGAAWEIGALVEASLVFIGFSAWLVVAARNWLWASVAVFAAMVAALTNIIRLLLRHGDEHGLSPLADPAGDHHLRPVSGLAHRRGVRPCRAALVFGGWSPDQTAWQAVSLVAATAAAVALAVAALPAAVLILGTPVARWVSPRGRHVSGRVTADR